MPFAGIAFLWFIGVVRDGFGGFEDKFFSSVFIGSGLLFLAMIFVSSAVGVALTHSGLEDAVFGQALLLALSKTYALRMAAVFMISLATIWLKTGLMPKMAGRRDLPCRRWAHPVRRRQHVADDGLPGMGAGGQRAAVDPGGRHRLDRDEH